MSSVPVSAASGQNPNASSQPPSPDFLRKHIGHEVKHLMFAAMEFSRPEAERWQVPLHDSALVRARTLIDFLLRSGDDRVVYVKDFYRTPGAAHPQAPANAHRWFDFLSARLTHIGEGREVEFDQWPDREEGQEKGDDRLERLARLVLDLMKTRLDSVRADCRPVLDEIIRRGEEYLDDPSDERFHAMDPKNLTARSTPPASENVSA